MTRYEVHCAAEEIIADWDDPREHARWMRDQALARVRELHEQLHAQECYLTECEQIAEAVERWWKGRP